MWVGGVGGVGGVLHQRRKSVDFAAKEDPGPTKLVSQNRLKQYCRVTSLIRNTHPPRITIGPYA